MMTYKILEAHGGRLPKDIRVAFANTGAEHPKTLDFVKDCALHWDLDIAWLELEISGRFGYSTKIVDYASASRKGEPFEALVASRKMVPNGRFRFCTQYLKVERLNDYAFSQLGEDYTTCIGLRADERERASKLGGWDQDRQMITPMIDAGVEPKDVEEFWGRRNFGLELPVAQGKTLHGNCVLCFHKGLRQKIEILQRTPEEADLYIRMEESTPLAKPSKNRTHATFNRDHSMRELKEMAQANQLLPGLEYTDEEVACGGCFCGE